MCEGNFHIWMTTKYSATLSVRCVHCLMLFVGGAEIGFTITIVQKKKINASDLT